MISKIKSLNNFDSVAILFCISIFIISIIIGSYHIIGTTDFYGTYAVQAKNILAWQPYTYQVNPPGYSILIALFSFLTGDLFIAGKILSSISTALIGVIYYFIFKKLFTEKIAFVSIIFLLIILIPFSFIAGTDLIGALFASVPILLFLNSKNNRLKSYLLIGLACGSAYLVRINTIFGLAGIIFSILFLINNDTWKRKFIKTGFLLIGFILITSPWFIYNWKLNGSPFATTAYEQIGYNLYEWKGSENEEIVEEISEHSSSPQVFFIEPLELAANFLVNLPSRTELFITGSFVFPVYLFLGGGIILFLMNLNRNQLEYLIIWILGFLSLGLISFDIRYYLVLIPLICVLVAYFFLSEKIFEISGKLKIFSWFLITILTLFLIKDSFTETKTLLNSEPKYLLEAADFLKSRSSPDDIIISRKPHIAYLSGLKREFLPEYSAQDYYKKAKEINARYIVYSDLENELWPGLYDFGYPDAVKDFFILIYEHKPTNTLIYEIK